MSVHIDKKKIQNYLRILQRIDELINQKNSIEAELTAYVKQTGEFVLCNILKVSYSNNPPKFVATTEGGKVTDEMRKQLIDALEDTEFVKTSITLENKKIHEQKDKNKVLKTALKNAGLDTEQTSKFSFDRIVKCSKK